MYNETMETLKIFIWIFVGILALYLLLSFVFIHLSLEYRKKIKNSEDIIASHIKSHTSLLELLLDELKKAHDFALEIDPVLLDENTANRIKHLEKTELILKTEVQKQSINLSQENNYFVALEGNTKLLRDEVFRYNSYVQNFNIICGSFIFRPIVKLLRLKKKDKY